MSTATIIGMCVGTVVSGGFILLINKLMAGFEQMTQEESE